MLAPSAGTERSDARSQSVTAPSGRCRTTGVARLEPESDRTQYCCPYRTVLRTPDQTAGGTWASDESARRPACADGRAHRDCGPHDRPCAHTAVQEEHTVHSGHRTLVATWRQSFPVHMNMCRRTGPGTRTSPLGRTARLLLTAAVCLLLVLATGRAAHAARGLVAAGPQAPPAGAAAAHPTDWIAPVPSPSVVRGFDPPAADWNAGHRGVDLAALPGESIRAPAAGTVRFAGVVAGKPVVSVSVGAWVMSVENVDAAVRKGDEVHPGHPIGTVAAPSHCTDGCVHVGVWPQGRETDYADPMPFFGRGDVILLPEAEAPEELPEVPHDSGRSGAGPWGGHDNGRIPTVALCALQTAPGHLLRCDAARAFDEMSHAYAQRFGTPVSVTDSYRDYDTQVILKRRKGRMAAAPGTSNHGWGLAMDLGGGINRFGAEAHTWMQANGPRFGWIHPSWARQGGSLPEAWHWEFAGE